MGDEGREIVPFFTKRKAAGGGLVLFKSRTHEAKNILILESDWLQRSLGCKVEELVKGI